MTSALLRAVLGGASLYFFLSPTADDRDPALQYLRQAFDTRYRTVSRCAMTPTSNPCTVIPNSKTCSPLKRKKLNATNLPADGDYSRLRESWPVRDRASWEKAFLDQSRT